MDDTPEVIRQNMEVTRSQLTNKLESLEQQLSDTVQTTGNAVNDTVETIQDVVNSVINACDVRRHIDRHPWLVLGGSVVLGYVAAEYLMGLEKQSRPSSQAATSPSPPSTDNERPGNGNAAVESATSAAALKAAYESGLNQSSWNQVRNVAIGALIGIVQDVAARAVPEVMGYLAGNQASHQNNAQANHGADAPTAPRNNTVSNSDDSPQKRFNVV